MDVLIRARTLLPPDLGSGMHHQRAGAIDFDQLSASTFIGSTEGSLPGATIKR